MGDDALYESQIIALLDEVESKATLNFFFIFQMNTVHYTQYTILQYEWVSNLGFVRPVNYHFYSSAWTFLLQHTTKIENTTIATFFGLFRQRNTNKLHIYKLKEYNL